jgi:Mrp family chromosome partitioning ATPase
MKDDIKHTLMILSGKGGVGKSTVSVNLALGFAMRGYSVGLLDADIHSPSIPKMLGISHGVLAPSGDGIEPVFIPPRLKVVSIGFFLPSEDTPVIWRGPIKYNAIKQFIEDVRWGDLEYLIVDLPPGTGDEPLSVAQIIGKVDGAIIVSTPQDVALLSVKKSVRFAEQLKIPVVGIIENMSGFVCPHCGRETPLFKVGGAEKAAKELKIPFLGRVPLDSRIVECGDEGKPSILSAENYSSTRALEEIVEKIEEFVKIMEGK